MTASVNRKIIDKAKKLHALYTDLAANESYEASVAKRKLDDIMSKYGISIEDIISIDRTEREFRYWTEEDKLLLHQIQYIMFGDDDKAPYLFVYTYYKRRKLLYIELSNAEFIEFTDLYDFHRNRVWQEIEKMKKLTFSAYISANKLYPDDSKVIDASDESDDTDKPSMSLDDMIIMATLANNMDFGTPTKKLNQ